MLFDFDFNDDGELDVFEYAEDHRKILLALIFSIIENI